MSVWKRLSFLFLLLVASPGFAASVSYDFSGSLNYASRGLQPELSAGEQFAGSFTVNGSGHSSRNHRDIINGEITVAGLEYQFTDYDLQLRDSSILDQYHIFNGYFGKGGIDGPSINGRAISSVQLIFRDWRGADGSFWGSPDGVNGLLANQLLNLALFDSAHVILRFGGRLAKGNISNLTATPLPAAVWMFLLGVGAVFGGRKLRAQNVAAASA